MLKHSGQNCGKNANWIPSNAVLMTKMLLSDRLTSAQCLLDLTAGNGNDTLFLAKSSPADAIIWAFDIQKQALDNTEDLLRKNDLMNKVRLVNDCHSRLDLYIEQPVDVVMFNLGYLPGGDRNFTTEAPKVIEALHKLLPLLATGGIVSIVVYPGHSPGKLEYEALHKYLTALPQRKYTVACWSMVNQANDPPVLFLLEKRWG